jgi:hypothetical protein
VGQDFILQPVFNRPLRAEQRASKSADEIAAAAYKTAPQLSNSY